MRPFQHFHSLSHLQVQQGLEGPAEGDGGSAGIGGRRSRGVESSKSVHPRPLSGRGGPNGGEAGAAVVVFTVAVVGFVAVMML